MQLNGWYQAGNGIVSVAQIPWKHYDTVYHFAAAPNSDGTINPLWIPPGESAAIIAARPAGKKVLLVLKDNDFDASAFSNATSSGRISLFVPNLVNFINNNGYDGVCLDWEHQNDGAAQGTNNARYIDLISRLRISLPSGKPIMMDAGDWDGLPYVANQTQLRLNGVNVMCYDMDNGGGPVWFNCATLAAASGQRACDTRLRAFSQVDPARVYLGIPFYTRRWNNVSKPLQSGGVQWNMPNGQPPSYRELVANTDFQVSYAQYDIGSQATYLSVPAPSNRFWNYVGVRQTSDLVGLAKTLGLGGVAPFCINMDDAAWTLSAALRAAVGGSVIIPPPPIVVPTYVKVEQSNGDITFKKM